MLTLNYIDLPFMPALSFIIRTDGRKMKLNALKILCPEVMVLYKNKHALDQENDQAKNKSFFFFFLVAFLVESTFSSFFS